MISNQERLDLLKEKVCDCQLCPLLAELRTQTVFGEGNPNSEIVFLGEAPGADEDKSGRPFVGRAGQLLDKIIESIGLKRDQVYICNVLKCRPPNNRVPTPEESSNCRSYLNLQLKVLNPKYIVCLGSTAAQNLLQTKESISALRGSWRKYNSIKVLCTYHPSYLLRNPNAKKDVWHDLQALVEKLNET